MAKPHQLPLFPLTANIWHAGHLPPALPDVVTPAQLHVGVGHRQVFGTTLFMRSQITRFIYFPRMTDVRALWPGGTGDLIECPAGSGRYYDAYDVDDVAKGFPNEFRVASIGVTANVVPPFPVPYP